MVSFQIHFEGMAFIAEQRPDGSILIKNQTVGIVELQMFYHLKESLVRGITNGDYDQQIKVAIEEEKETIFL